MTVLEQQHAAEALSLVDLGAIGVGGFLFVAMMTIGKGLLRDHQARQRRMDARVLEAWHREVAARSEAKRHDWATALDFPWPSDSERREPRLRLVDAPSDRRVA